MRTRLIRTGLRRRAREERGCAVVLMYHSISHRRPDRFNICVDPDLFAEQLQLLHDRFRVVSLGELRSALVGEEPLTRTVAITFDDGYRDNLLRREASARAARFAGHRLRRYRLRRLGS